MTKPQACIEQPGGSTPGVSPYAEIEAAIATMDGGGEAQGASRAIRAYAALGLWAPAAALLAGLDSASAPTGELDAIRATIQSQGTGRVDWAACQGRFKRNLAVLLKQDPRFGRVEEAWTASRPHYELFRATDGNYQIAQAADGGRRQWVPALRDHKAWALQQPLQHQEGVLMPAPYLFEGLGMGHYFRRVYEASKDTFLGYSCALYVVERDPVAFAISLHLHDWRAMFEDPRVMIFIGEDSLHRLASCLEDDLALPLPGLCVQMPRWSRGLDPAPMEIVGRLAAGRRQAEAAALAKLEQRYADRDAAYWSRRFDEALEGTGQPLRILSAVSIHTTFLQYSLRDATQALEELGCETRLLTEQSNHHVIGNSTYHRVIEEFNPDLFFVLDHLRGPHAAYVPSGLPVFTWDQDLLPHAINAETIRNMGPLDVLASVSAAHCVTKLGCDENRTINCIMPTNPARFSGEAMDEAELEAHRCDVSYVSNASQSPGDFHKEQWEGLGDETSRRVLQAVHDEIRAEAERCPRVPNERRRAAIDVAAGKLGVRVPERFGNWLGSWYIWRLLDRIFRHQALAWAADWALENGRALHLYGRGWENHKTLHAFARGVAHNEQELRRIYQASAINLQLIPSGFLHQRAMDGLAAGGFFLSRKACSDQQSAVMQPILARAAEIGVTTLGEPAARADRTLQEALVAYEEETGQHPDPDDDMSLAYLRIAARDPCAGSVFPGFERLVFDDAVSFRRTADYFLDNAGERRSVASQMRQVVLERFSYKDTMRRFLDGHRRYLKASASKP